MSLKLIGKDGWPMVYMGGGLDSDWRVKFKDRFAPQLITYDPMTQSRQGSIYEFTSDDLDALQASQLLVARVDFERYTGLALEVGYARALNIPVMLIWLIGGRVDSMMAACSSWVFVDHEEAMDFIERRLI